MSDKNPHVYQLPGEVAAALSTNRPQFVTMLINRVKEGHVVEPKHVVGVLEAFRDIVQMRADDHQRTQAVERYLKNLDLSLEGIHTQIHKIQRVAGRIGSTEPIDPEEIE